MNVDFTFISCIQPTCGTACLKCPKDLPACLAQSVMSRKVEGRCFICYCRFFQLSDSCDALLACQIRSRSTPSEWVSTMLQRSPHRSMILTMCLSFARCRQQKSLQNSNIDILTHSMPRWTYSCLPNGLYNEICQEQSASGTLKLQRSHWGFEQEASTPSPLLLLPFDVFIKICVRLEMCSAQIQCCLSCNIYHLQECFLNFQVTGAVPQSTSNVGTEVEIANSARGSTAWHKSVFTIKAATDTVKCGFAVMNDGSGAVRNVSHFPYKHELRVQ